MRKLETGILKKEYKGMGTRLDTAEERGKKSATADLSNNTGKK